MSHESELRCRALDVAARLTATIKLDPPGTIEDLENITIGMADRFHHWINTGRTRVR